MIDCQIKMEYNQYEVKIRQGAFSIPMKERMASLPGLKKKGVLSPRSSLNYKPLEAMGGANNTAMF